MIIERKKIIDAYVRQLLLGGGHDDACKGTAASLGIPEDTVRDVIRAEYTPAGSAA